VVILVTFAIAPAISAPRPAAIPVRSLSAAGSDYYQRHPEWAVSAQSAVVPVTSAAEASDYFTRHPELHTPAQTSDLSDYFLRHSELTSANRDVPARLPSSSVGTRQPAPSYLRRCGSLLVKIDIHACLM
jgi:hypothetical protein